MLPTSSASNSEVTSGKSTPQLSEKSQEPGTDVKPSPQMLDQLIQSKLATAPSTSHRARGIGQEQAHYANKLKKIKRAIKDTIFMNGAMCDEVLRTEEKLAKAKEERRFLLRKLLQYQSANEATTTVKTESLAPPAKQAKTGLGLGDTPPQEPPSKPPKGVKRKAPSASPLTPGLGPLVASMAGHLQEQPKKHPKTGKDMKNATPRAKKGKGATKKVIPPLMLDSLGRPVFPMVLGDVTLHSIGEIVPEHLSFHCVASIYPLGYCITRVYTSLHKVDQRCLYTCKISDNLDVPVFEIAAEDSSDLVFRGATPSECHTNMLIALNKARGDVVPTDGKGLDFFGLSHPVIQNLIQSCPGARKCQRYKWVKFEINKAECNENMAVGTADPTVSFDALRIHLVALGQSRSSFQEQTEQSNNLRSLLTKGHAALASS